MARKPTSPRTARREADRAAVKLADARTRLADLEPGGGRDHPIEVASASQVEPRARSIRCPRCGGELKLEEHSVRDDRRVAAMKCAACGTRRTVWFRLGSALPS